MMKMKKPLFWAMKIWRFFFKNIPGKEVPGSPTGRFQVFARYQISLGPNPALAKYPDYGFRLEIRDFAEYIFCAKLY